MARCQIKYRSAMIALVLGALHLVIGYIAFRNYSANYFLLIGQACWLGIFLGAGRAHPIIRWGGSSLAVIYFVAVLCGSFSSQVDLELLFLVSILLFSASGARCGYILFIVCQAGSDRGLRWTTWDVGVEVLGMSGMLSVVLLFLPDNRMGDIDLLFLCSWVLVAIPLVISAVLFMPLALAVAFSGKIVSGIYLTSVVVNPLVFYCLRGLVFQKDHFSFADCYVLNFVISLIVLVSTLPVAEWYMPCGNRPLPPTSC